jgi:hypothetical protein
MVSRTRSVDGSEVKIDLQIVLEGCLHESGLVKATISDRCFLLNAKYGSPLSDLQRMQQPSLNPPALPAAPRPASTCAKAMLTMLEALLKSVDIILGMGHPMREISGRLGRAWALQLNLLCTQSVGKWMMMRLES